MEKHERDSALTTALKDQMIYGVHFSFEGGEEDDTIRPTILSHETLEEMKDSTGLPSKTGPKETVTRNENTAN
jgi:hypothetical protein